MKTVLNCAELAPRYNRGPALSNLVEKRSQEMAKEADCRSEKAGEEPSEVAQRPPELLCGAFSLTVTTS